jgi:hypothetical protein
MNPLSLSLASIVEGLTLALGKMAQDTAEIGQGPGEPERLMDEKLKRDGWSMRDVQEARNRRK